MWNRTFKKIEKALGFKLYKWQRNYIMMSSDYIPYDRGCGATTAFILRHLLDYGEKIGTYQDSLLFKSYKNINYNLYFNIFPVDRDRDCYSDYVFKYYPNYVIKIDRLLKSVGIDTCFR